MRKTWVVVADRSRARFFSLESLIQPMQEFEGMVHEEGRLSGGDELSDRQGGIAGGHGEADHTFEAPTDFKQHQAEVFARQIEEKLEFGRVNHQYQQLILVAPPFFLGVLRQILNPHILQLVSHSLDKNLVVEDEKLIREHIV